VNTTKKTTTNPGTFNLLSEVSELNHISLPCVVHAEDLIAHVFSRVSKGLTGLNRNQIRRKGYRFLRKDLPNHCQSLVRIFMSSHNRYVPIQKRKRVITISSRQTLIKKGLRP